MEHDAEARRGFARMGFGFVLLLGVSRQQGWSFRLTASFRCARAQVQALPEAVPDPRALLRRRLPLPPLPQRVHGAVLLLPSPPSPAHLLPFTSDA